MAEPQPQYPIQPVIPLSPGRQPPTSFLARIILFVFLSTFLTAAIVSTLAIESMRRGIRDQLGIRLASVIDRRATRVDTYLRAGQHALHVSLEGLAEASIEAPELEEILRQTPQLSAVALFDASGRVIESTGDIPDLEWPEAAPPTAVGELIALQPRDGGHPLAAVRARPTSDGLPPGGSVVGLLDLAPLLPDLALEAHEGSGRTLIATPGGIVLQETGAVRGDADGRAMLEWLLAHRDGDAQRFIDNRGSHGIGTVRELALPGWYLIVETSFEDAYAPMMTVIERIILCDLMIILLFSFLAYRITSALMNPIGALSKAAAAMSQGDELHEIPVPSNSDEIGLLTSCFNDMVRRLKRNRLEIEQDKRALTEQNEELQRANEVLAQLSITDGLTKLHNHRYFQDHLTREIKRLSRTDQPLSIILIDLDDFKKLNDRHGHAVGDEVLTSVATLMNDSVRESDLLARYGGEEFVILAPNTALDGALSMAEKIRMTVEQATQIFDEARHSVRVTLSCGVAQYRGDRKRFFQAADRALYAAKAEGKNCVVADSQD
jgi:diguanylate cyclase (GGDEF)-like protein